MKTRIVHCKKENFDIYIGRPSIWGNPFAVGRHGSREQVIEKYKEHVLQDPLLMARIMELDGKILGCWCPPEHCHGDSLIEIIQGIKKGEIKR